VSKRPRIERKNGRIYIGDGDLLWSFHDPVCLDLSEPSWVALTLARDWAYLLRTFPDTKTALEKLRLIRWAIRNVPIQRPNRGGDNG
jgi:hypothetical protein